MSLILRCFGGVLVLVAWSGLAVPPRGASLLMEWPGSRPGRELFLELGPQLGHVSSSNALIWAQASRPARLAVRLSRNEDLSGARKVRGPILGTNSDCMGHVSLTGLQPSQRYYYCMLLDNEPVLSPPYPSFVTAPAEGVPGTVRFAFTSCVGYHGYDAAPGYADLAARTNVDLLLMLGDNHYANSTRPAPQRSAYADQRRQAGWRDLAARIPVYAIWDDHDYGPDNSDGTLKNKARSLQTFREHWANPAYGETDNPGVYFRFSRGAVDFFMLDVRYHRSPNQAKDSARKTMLGPRQLAWLKRELLASRAPVKVIAAGGEWQRHGTGDSWTSFPRERDEIFRFLEAHGISGVLLISGDRHFTAAYQVQGRWIEVTAGPLGSSNARTRPTPEMFYYAGDKGKFYCVFDIDTRPPVPAATLEVYRVGEGLATRRAFTWDEVLGVTPIKLLPARGSP